MAVEAFEAQPVFDPRDVGGSLSVIQAQIPAVRRPWLAGTVLGEVVSKRKGPGHEADGVRDYVPLDDPRDIDWRITARQPDGVLQVRERFRDIIPALWIVTDTLQNRNAKNPNYFSEQKLALSAIMGLMRMAELQRMPTAVIAGDDQGLVVDQRRPKQGRTHMLRTGEALAEAAIASENAETDLIDTPYHLSELLDYAAHRCTRSIVAIISDFRDVPYPDVQNYGWGSAIEKLTRRGNDLVAIETQNKWDRAVPPEMGRLKVGRRKVVSISPEQRAAFAEAATVQQAAIDAQLAATGAHHIRLSAEEPLWRDAFCDQLRALGQRRKH